ncbi:MAG: epoxyqueuosine reductase QueH [Tannerella sp.]|nr:epoxyqueuosine reductase QueH [Tannerella sp.]
MPLQAPGGAKEVLLHACCAPCSGAIIECMLANGLCPTVFYYNPNIYPYEEYARRKAESIRHAAALQLPFVDGDYDRDTWQEQIRGLENEPERGRRCLSCFRMRLAETAHYAHAHGFSVFATTLASSRWKNLQQITVAGQHAASLHPGLVFWTQNWRRGGLSMRRSKLIREYGFYSQRYCGCEYSLRTSPFKTSHT